MASKEMTLKALKDLRSMARKTMVASGGQVLRPVPHEEESSQYKKEGKEDECKECKGKGCKECEEEPKPSPTPGGVMSITISKH